MKYKDILKVLQEGEGFKDTPGYGDLSGLKKKLPKEAKFILRQYDQNEITKKSAVEKLMSILNCKQGSANLILADKDNR
jgi:hypothetical protein